MPCSVLRRAGGLVADGSGAFHFACGVVRVDSAGRGAVECPVEPGR